MNLKSLEKHMKSALIGLIIGILFSSSILGATLNCEQSFYEHNGMFVSAQINGDFSVVSEKEVKFSKVTFKYSIYEDNNEEYIWSAGLKELENFSNKLDYRPRKYFGHMKFPVWVNEIAGSPYYGFGYLDLIVPAKNLKSSEPSSFTSYLIMTYMDDHYGGTIKLNCSIK